ncbi:hypothetical protein B0T17DRAFT_528360 [Bombardia bombarda]|uniref:Uncharacterized protein n=1 Tax=Bombardia bombarda TaxID=252184 RepID=A0AA39XAM1_9PEZI|nr:hypothetical protein B0T17DRAFT_528360 [Bombardia bombarda]
MKLWPTLGPIVVKPTGYPQIENASWYATNKFHHMPESASETEADRIGLALSSFQLNGPNGIHTCLVHPLNGNQLCFRLWDPIGEAYFVSQAKTVQHIILKRFISVRRDRGSDDPTVTTGEEKKEKHKKSGHVASVHDISERDMLRILGRPKVIPYVRPRGLKREPDYRFPEYLVLRPMTRGGQTSWDAGPKVKRVFFEDKAWEPV